MVLLDVPVALVSMVLLVVLKEVIVAFEVIKVVVVEYVVIVL
tara:strand:+ start:155 stop:280 length:126 start_codon:yes stop_codon:yes gene_type:complete